MAHPAHPEVLPLGEHSGMAIFIAGDPWRWSRRLGGKAIQVRMLTGPAPMAVGRAEAGQRLRPLRFGAPFTEHHPAHWREVDSPPRAELADASKLGGYARFPQGGEEEAIAQQWSSTRCSRCRRRLEGRVQLTPGLIDIGDCGSLYVYVCPRGCEAKARAESW